MYIVYKDSATDFRYFYLTLPSWVSEVWGIFSVLNSFSCWQIISKIHGEFEVLTLRQVLAATSKLSPPLLCLDEDFVSVCTGKVFSPVCFSSTHIMQNHNIQSSSFLVWLCRFWANLCSLTFKAAMSHISCMNVCNVKRSLTVMSAQKLVTYIQFLLAPQSFVYV